MKKQADSVVIPIRPMSDKDICKARFIALRRALENEGIDPDVVLNAITDVTMEMFNEAAARNRAAETL